MAFKRHDIICYIHFITNKKDLELNKKITTLWKGKSSTCIHVNLQEQTYHMIVFNI